MWSSLCFAALAACATASATAGDKPNIVYIMTDDQDVELGGLTPMPKTRDLLGAQGAVGESFYIATPICCPSRTETLSGRLYHNVLTDTLEGCMHVNSTGYIFQNKASLFPQLQSAGYMTGGFGKIINGQKGVFNPKRGQPITNGWDWISAPLNEGDYFANEMFNKRPNGSHWIESLGEPNEVVDTWYQTSQIGNRSIEFIRAAVAAQKPFVAYLGPHAPHYSADAPPWARELFSNLTAPRTPAYNTSVGQADKTQHVAQNPPINADMEHWIDAHFRDRWRAISGVDDMVALVHDELDRLGVLDNTYMFFTSDHGYKLGEWRIGCSKQHPYETDVHIPFFARGPGIKPGTRLTALGSNIDIAPTFIDIAGLPPNPEHDGRSVLPMLHSTQQSSERLAIEATWRTELFIAYLSVGTYYNDHAKIWVSGPGAVPGTMPVYGHGPATVNPQFDTKHCPATENSTVGNGPCHFVDSTQSNNWIGVRVRNSTHNFMYAESYGSQAMNMQHHALTGPWKGVFKCIAGDYCNRELYDYGPITSDYPNYPVMTDERWCLTNSYKTSAPAMQDALHGHLQNTYCSTRRLVDRMDCSP
eukprot:m.321999 g.321999  ORF g.321999 m.321999 type:complete len:588 (-) comp20343_c0_seq1:248-2011(-)